MFGFNEEVEIQMESSADAGVAAASMLLNLVSLANSARVTEIKKRKEKWRDICQLGFPELTVYELKDTPALTTP